MKAHPTHDIEVSITGEPVGTESVLAGVTAGTGAVVSFVGVVRDHDGGRKVTGIYYDCYREMAQREAERIAREIRESFGVQAVRLIHRVGELAVGDVSLFVVVASAHRGDAFDAARTIVERVKERLPVWKKERYADGESQWL